ncbi:MAG: hypothetical protein ACREA3_08625 [Nitrosotalea sp.]
MNRALTDAERKKQLQKKVKGCPICLKGDSLRFDRNSTSIGCITCNIEFEIIIDLADLSESLS